MSRINSIAWASVLPDSEHSTTAIVSTPTVSHYLCSTYLQVYFILTAMLTLSLPTSE